MKKPLNVKLFQREHSEIPFQKSLVLVQSGEEVHERARERNAERRGWIAGARGLERVFHGRGKARRMGWPFNICPLHLADFPGKIDMGRL